MTMCLDYSHYRVELVLQNKFLLYYKEIDAAMPLCNNIAHSFFIVEGNNQQWQNLCRHRRYLLKLELRFSCCLLLPREPSGGQVERPPTKFDDFNSGSDNDWSIIRV